MNAFDFFVISAVVLTIVAILTLVIAIKKSKQKSKN